MNVPGARHRLALAFLVCLTGCARTGTPPTDPTSEAHDVHVAIFPAEWLTLRPTIDIEAATIVADALMEHSGVFVRDAETTEDALSAEIEGCTDDLSCIRRVAGSLGVNQTVRIVLASLGDTVVVRVRMTEAQSGAGEVALQEEVRDASPERVSLALQNMAAELGRSLAPRETSRRWYQRWWVWTIIGTVVIGAGAAIVVTATAEDDVQGPDVIIDPP